MAVTTDELLGKINDSITALQDAQQTVVDGASQLGNALHRTGDETVSGQKTFNSSPLVPTAGKGDNTTKSASTAFVKTAVDQAKSDVTILMRDELRAEIEHASSGRNTVVRDKDGDPHVMVVIPRFNLQDIDSSLGTGTHPAFIVNGVEKTEILMGKYLASKSSSGKVQTLARKAPWASINFDNALAACRALGTGFGLCSNAIFAARALWLWKELGLEHEYLGNSNWGRSHSKPEQTGTMQTAAFHPGDSGNNVTGATLTGSGPDAWNDDSTPYGVSDLVGNVWEWVSGFRLMDQEIQILPNNDAMLASANMAANSSAWKAILEDGSLVAPGTGGTLKFNAPATGNAGESKNVGAPTLSTTLTNQLVGNNHSNATFSTLKAADGVTVPAILKQLGVMPISTEGVQGYCWLRSGERLPIRGGNWGLAGDCGPFALDLDNLRSRVHWAFGFRAAFVS